MSSENAVETTGATVEEAIQKGLDELGAASAEVFVDVLDEGSPGVFGLEGRPARVRLERMIRTSAPPLTGSTSVISTPYTESTPITLPSAAAYEESEDDGPTRQATETSRPEAERRAPRDRDESRGGGERRSGDSRRGPRPPRREEQDTPDYLEFDMEETEDSSLPFLTEMEDIPEEELDEEASIGKVVLNELLERMSIRARIVVRHAPAGDQADSTPWILDVQGNNLTRLIGRRGETLAALQYVTRLITSRELQRRAEVIVDVTGYKARRAQALHNLALRMANEALERGRTVTLEPMPPHERRIVHMALRGREDVTTKSVGEGSGRKVTIVPTQQAS